MNAAADVDAYLMGLPEEIRATLVEVRRLVRTIAPDAAESISYGMPTYKVGGRPLIYFGAAKKHWALYGTREGTVRFPVGKAPDEAYLRGLIEARRGEIGPAAVGKRAARARG